MGKEKRFDQENDTTHRFGELPVVGKLDAQMYNGNKTVPYEKSYQQQT